jgi:hypothetical protein
VAVPNLDKILPPEMLPKLPDLPKVPEIPAAPDVQVPQAPKVEPKAAEDVLDFLLGS